MKSTPSETAMVYILRGLLIAEIVMTILAVPLSLFSSMIAESAFQEARLTQETSDATVAVVGYIHLLFFFAIAILPALIVSWIGLFNFWSWSRWLYLLTNVAAYLLAIPLGFFDFSFQWGLPSAILDLAQPLTGAIAAIVFFSPISVRFDRVRSTVPLPPEVAMA
jgi:hypothetical protein